MLLTSVHIATSVAALLVSSAPFAVAQTAPTTNNWGGCAMCPAQPPVCAPGCAKCVVTLGTCDACATATCAPAGQQEEGLRPLGEDPINAKLPGVSVTGGGPGLPGTGTDGVTEASEKRSGAGRSWKVTSVASVGALVVAGAIAVV